MQKHSSHVMTMTFMNWFMDVGVIVHIRCMIVRMMLFVMRVMPEVVARGQWRRLEIESQPHPHNDMACTLT